jgi:hypothetical protein
MNRSYIAFLSLLVAGCYRPIYLQNIEDDQVDVSEPQNLDSDSRTDTDTTIVDTPEDVVDETIEPVQNDSDTVPTTDSPVQDTASDVVEPENPVVVDTVPDPENDTAHPTMDSDGQPLYPTIPEDFTDTGVAPPSVPGTPGTVADCNIPDDFMLTTYYDRDQDGYGANQTSGLVWDNSYYNYSIYMDSPVCASHWTYSNVFKTSNCISYAPGNVSELMTVQLRDFAGINQDLQYSNLSQTSIRLFPEIYDEPLAFDRFTQAVDIINNEGSLTFQLTYQQAMTTHRKDFRDQLAQISEYRCASQTWCALTNMVYSVNSYGVQTMIGFADDIYLTYAGDNGAGDLDPEGSPYWASFWNGDESNGIITSVRTTGCWFNCSMDIYTSYDLSTQHNDGFYVCDWFDDDADGDGFTLEEGDCHDGASWIYPGAPEIPSNGTDNNCDGYEECFIDGDGDGFVGTSNTTTIVGTDCGSFSRPSDCNDNSSAIYPGAPERACDHADQNCNGNDYN